MIAQFFRYGQIIELDYVGNGENNHAQICPGARVRVLEGATYESPWLRILTPKNDSGGVDYQPLDIGAIVVIGCPGGVIDQGIILGQIHTIPDEAENYPADTKVQKFGGLVITWDRRESNEEYKIVTPNGHVFALRDNVLSGGAILQTADGHGLGMADLDPESRVELYHKNGTKIVFDENGDCTITVIRDSNETIGRDSNITIGGNQNIQVTGTINISSLGAVTIQGLSVLIKGDTSITLQTLAGLIAGIQTQLTHPVCYVTGAPIGGSVTVKADA